MSDLRSFARDTERSVDPPPFEVMIAGRRRARHRRAAFSVAAAVAAVLALALALAGLGQLHHKQIPALPAPQLLVPDWTADQIVDHPDAFVVKQLESHTDSRTVLTVWERCPHPDPHHDCLGREAIAVVDGSGHRLVTLGAVTNSSQQPSVAGDGLLREVAPGVWYWAHQHPGPYLVSATMRQPVQLTVSDRPATHGFGAPSIECADQVGLCTLDLNARTLGRLAIPQVPDTRWATPTALGCGLWGLAGVGANLRLVIQQRDGSFASADLPTAPYSTTMAEGGPNCEVAYYQNVTDNRDQLVVSLDHGKTWQIRQTPLPQVAGYYEHQPRDRFLIPPHWADLPPMTHPLKSPGTLHPL
ncbi:MULTISPECIES: hypothetical protein [unclassified Terrabacter]|uniref:hypothetical protein n=1 Tax=unclassified Terrabacter TaxID=2630222 RepID=UPI00070047AE|nr:MULTISPECIES: hypothetical protein [unclassified Terrabacter]KRB43575.1 hypothetical protein ASD90_18125 [Terrabacter sp. Root181]KRF47071.1 hypothetical protein ASG96_03435 [Terrabacter sp. Soil810]